MFSSGDTVFRDRYLPGFGIRVYATGRKVWCVQFRGLWGKPRRVALGPFGKVSPGEARRKAKVVIDRIKQGLNPEPTLRLIRWRVVGRFQIALVMNAVARATREESFHLHPVKDDDQALVILRQPTGPVFDGRESSS
ncbi:MAG: Arm DNA-binding domain-containing protein [Gammaproteobacteria bacterium]|nr:Arm DNA-binding domain-containing protein [Gammaproteobacteria bacterium]